VAALAWDTTIASRLTPGSQLLELVLLRARHADPIGLPAPVLSELAFGWERRTTVDPRFATQLAWLRREILERGILTVLPLTGEGAVVAGRLRAYADELPPARRGDRRSRRQRWAAWLSDIQVAAVSWSAGYDLITANVRDFERLREHLAGLAPGAPPLRVLELQI
jgi:predicted nucleic acid-binding protein